MSNSVERFSVRSSDIDEVRAFGGRYFFPRKFLRPLCRSGRLDARFDGLRFGSLTICDARYGADVTLGYEPDAYQVGVPLAGSLIAHQGDRAILGAGNQAAVSRVGEDVVLDRWGAGCRQLVVKIERGALDHQLEDLLGVSVRGPIRLSGQLDIGAGPGRSWAALVRLVAGEFGNTTGMLNHPAIVSNVHDAVTTGLLLAADHPDRESLDRPVRAYRPPAVRRAIEAIHAHPDHPFTAATLARTANVSMRTLQAGFQRYTGRSPMAYLREVRLARAHEDLRVADPSETTVGRIAHRWGFMHLGRFAALYRARYRTTPSQTLHSF